MSQPGCRSSCWYVSLTRNPTVLIDLAAAGLNLTEPCSTGELPKNRDAEREMIANFLQELAETYFASFTMQRQRRYQR
jgi:hypothetical protein